MAARKTKTIKPKTSKPDEESPQRHRLAPLLRCVWYGLNQAFRRRIVHTRITPDQFTILRWLSEHEMNGLTANRLSELMSSDPNTIAALLGRMKRAGLLVRQPHESDRRAWRNRLTAQGRRVFAELKQHALKLQKELLAAIPASERDKFLDHLERVAHACRAALSSDEKRMEAAAAKPFIHRASGVP